MTRNRWVWITGLAGSLLGLLIQVFIRKAFEAQLSPKTLPLIPGIFHLTYLKNPGVAFSWFAPNLVSWLLWLRLILMGSIAGVTLLFSRFRKEMILPLQIGLGLLLAGGIGNTAEQLLYGDIAIYLDWRSPPLPVLNLADLAVRLGSFVTNISILYWLLATLIRRFR
ncbi:MAG: signal peptidase II [Cyanobacteriota bacterium]